ncbi:MAG: hypothetical protein HQ528_08680 [Candidatus Marinimicrobia bacterium]|nr:hypothetical protein [Candidatus Neomarinimicrobiota bacterium]
MRKIITVFSVLVLSLTVVLPANSEQDLAVQPVTITQVRAAFGTRAVASFDGQSGSVTQILVDVAPSFIRQNNQELPAIAEALVAQFPEIYRINPAELKMEVNQTAGMLNYLIYRQT